MGDSTKPVLWTLDSKMDSLFRLEFQSPGVKGHVHINQQQSFEYSIICRLHNFLLTVIILTGI